MSAALDQRPAPQQQKTAPKAAPPRQKLASTRRRQASDVRAGSSGKQKDQPTLLDKVRAAQASQIDQLRKQLTGLFVGGGDAEVVLRELVPLPDAVIPIVMDGLRQGGKLKTFFDKLGASHGASYRREVLFSTVAAQRADLSGFDPGTIEAMPLAECGVLEAWAATQLLRKLPGKAARRLLRGPQRAELRRLTALAADEKKLKAANDAADKEAHAYADGTLKSKKKAAEWAKTHAAFLKSLLDVMQKWIVRDADARLVVQSIAHHAGNPAAMQAIAMALKSKGVLDKLFDEIPEAERYSGASSKVLLGLMPYRAASKTLADIAKMLDYGGVSGWSKSHALKVWLLVRTLPSGLQEQLRRQSGGRLQLALEKHLPPAVITSGAYQGFGKMKAPASTKGTRDAVAKGQKVASAADARALWASLGGMDAATRRAVVFQLDALGVINRCMGLLGFAEVLAGELQPHTEAIAGSRELIRLLGHVRELLQQGSQPAAYLAFRQLKALRGGELTWALAQKHAKGTIGSTLKEKLAYEHLVELGTNFYQGGADWKRIRTQLSDGALWTDKARKDALSNLLRMALAAGRGRWLFAQSKAFALHQHHADLCQAHGLFHPKLRTVYQAPQTAKKKREKAVSWTHLAGQGLSRVTASSKGYHGRGFEGRKTLKFFGQGIDLAKSKDPKANKLDFDADFKGGRLSLRGPNLQIASVARAMGTTMLKTGPGALTDLRVEMSWPTKARGADARGLSMRVKIGTLRLTDVLLTTQSSMVGMKALGLKNVDSLWGDLDGGILDAVRRKQLSNEPLPKSVWDKIGNFFRMAVGIFKDFVPLVWGGGIIPGEVVPQLKKLGGSEKAKRLYARFGATEIKGLSTSGGVHIKSLDLKNVQLSGGDRRSTYLFARIGLLKDKLAKAKGPAKARLNTQIAALKAKWMQACKDEADLDLLRAQSKKDPVAFGNDPEKMKRLRALEKATQGGYVLSIGSVDATGVKSGSGSARNVSAKGISGDASSTSALSTVLNSAHLVAGKVPISRDKGSLQVDSLSASGVRVHTGVPKAAQVKSVIADLQAKAKDGALDPRDTKRLASLQANLPKVERYEVLQGRKTRSADEKRELATLKAVLERWSALQITKLAVLGLSAQGARSKGPNPNGQARIRIAQISARGAGGVLTGGVAKHARVRQLELKGATDGGGTASLSIGGLDVQASQGPIARAKAELAGLEKKADKSDEDRARIAALRAKIADFDKLGARAGALQKQLDRVGKRLGRRLRASTRAKLVAKRKALRAELAKVRRRLAYLGTNLGSVSSGPMSVHVKGFGNPLLQGYTPTGKTMKIRVDLAPITWSGADLRSPGFELQAASAQLGKTAAEVTLRLGKDPKTKATRLELLNLDNLAIKSVGATGLNLKLPVGDELVRIQVPTAELKGIEAAGIQLKGKKAFDPQTFAGHFVLGEAQAKVSAQIGDYFKAGGKLSSGAIELHAFKSGQATFDLAGLTLDKLGFRKKGRAPKGSVVSAIRSLRGKIERLGKLGAHASLNRKTGLMQFALGLDQLKLTGVSWRGSGLKLGVRSGAMRGAHVRGRAALDPDVLFKGKKGKALKDLKLDLLEISRIAGHGLVVRNHDDSIDVNLQRGVLTGIRLRNFELKDKSFDLDVRGVDIKKLKADVDILKRGAIPLAIQANATAKVGGLHVSRAKSGGLSFGISKGSLDNLGVKAVHGQNHYFVHGHGKVGRVSGRADNKGVRGRFKGLGGFITASHLDLGRGKSKGRGDASLGSMGGTFHVGKDGVKTSLDLTDLDLGGTLHFGDGHASLDKSAKLPRARVVVHYTPGTKKQKGKPATPGRVVINELDVPVVKVPEASIRLPSKGLHAEVKQGQLLGLSAKKLGFDFTGKLLSGSAGLKGASLNTIKARFGSHLSLKASAGLKNLRIKALAAGGFRGTFQSLYAKARAHDPAHRGRKSTLSLGVNKGKTGTGGVIDHRGGKTRIDLHRLSGSASNKAKSPSYHHLLSRGGGKPAPHKKGDPIYRWRWRLPILSALDGTLYFDLPLDRGVHRIPILVRRGVIDVATLKRSIWWLLTTYLGNGVVRDIGYYKAATAINAKLSGQMIRKSVQAAVSGIKMPQTKGSSPTEVGGPQLALALARAIDGTLGKTVSSWGLWLMTPKKKTTKAVDARWRKEGGKNKNVKDLGHRTFALLRNMTATAKLKAVGDIYGDRRVEFPVRGLYKTLVRAKLGVWVDAGPAKWGKGLTPRLKVQVPEAHVNDGKTGGTRVRALGTTVNASASTKLDAKGKSTLGARVAFQTKHLTVWLGK